MNDECIVMRPYPYTIDDRTSPLEAHDKCPKDGGRLIYHIAVDAYVCASCKTHYEVLSVERSHINYNGGPPQEIDQ
jgi:hypothetical protein